MVSNRLVCLIVALTFSATIGPIAAYATSPSSGLDTPSGVKSLPFSVEGQEMMDLTEAGLGIGTTAPSDLLEVHSSSANADLLLAGAGSANDYALLRLANTNSGAEWDISHRKANGPADGLMFGYYNGSAWTATPLTLTTSGNVGIGTTAPSDMLEVSSSANADLLLAGAGSANDYALLRLANTNSGAEWDISHRKANGPADGLMFDYYNGSAWTATPLTLTTSGNVGINTTNPATTLDVNGPVRPGGATLGSGCSPAGAMAYDSGSDKPVYCSNRTGTWTSLGLSYCTPRVATVTGAWSVSAQSNCQAGETVAGGSSDCSSSGGAGEMTTISSYQSGNGWYGSCWDSSNYGSQTTVHATAICCH